MVHPVMLGRALVDAYEIEKTLQFAGCIITDAALHSAKGTNESLFQHNWQELENEHKVVLYEVPKKNGALKTWTINWVSRASNPTHDDIKDGFALYKKGIDHPDVIAKMENTLLYYSHVKLEIFGSRKSQEAR